jgi:hypothetical protein
VTVHRTGCAMAIQSLMEPSIQAADAPTFDSRVAPMWLAPAPLLPQAASSKPATKYRFLTIHISGTYTSTSALCPSAYQHLETLPTSTCVKSCSLHKDSQYEGFPRVLHQLSPIGCSVIGQYGSPVARASLFRRHLFKESFDTVSRLDIATAQTPN